MSKREYPQKVLAVLGVTESVEFAAALRDRAGTLRHDAWVARHQGQDELGHKLEKIADTLERLGDAAFGNVVRISEE